MPGVPAAHVAVAQEAPAPSPAAAFEPPAMDLRTGIITVSDDVLEEKPKQKPATKKTLSAPSPKKADVVKKEPAPRPGTRHGERAPVQIEEAFDLEKAISGAPAAQPAQAPASPLDTQALHAERIEKTMQWDKSQLASAAASSPEAVVVEGAEVVHELAAAPRGQQKEKPPEGKDEPIISGEDIENTLDSFFGLGGK